MAITDRREKEKRVMRQSILEAAMELFVGEGYDSVSIRKIADKIEYSPSTIYLYFEDKDDIFFELHNLGFNEFYKHQMEAQRVADPKERLIAHGRAYLSFALEHSQYYDLMFIVRSPGDKIKKFKNWELGDRCYDLLKKNVAECKEAGYFKGKDEKAVALVFWSVMHGMISLHIRNRLIHIDSEGKELINSIIFEQSLSIVRSFIV